jgi:hypothetical protein
MRMLNRAKLALLPLACVALLCFATGAQAGQDPGAESSAQPAIAAAETASGTTVTPGNEAAATAGDATPEPSTGAEASSSEATTDTRGSDDAPATVTATGSGTAQPPTQTQPGGAAGSLEGSASTISAAGDETTGGRSEAVGEASAQAATAQAGPSGSGDHNLSAAESNATIQQIWQVQISGCTVHCRDISQAQTAEQENRTVQVLEGASTLATGSGTQALTGDGSQTTVSITQIQLGCLSHCFGATTSAGSAALSAYRQLLEQFLKVIASGLPSLIPAPASQQNVVKQASYQWQYGQGATLAQMQDSSQASTTVQVDDVSSPPTAGLEAALADAEAAAVETVNQTEQGIWQLQIGCLIFCEHTQQYQQAEQSNTTIETVAYVSASSSATITSSVNVTTQVIWQVQIGCLFWCFETILQQTATSQNTVVMIVSGGATVAPPPDTTPVSTEARGEQVHRAPQAEGSTVGGGAAGPGAIPPTSTPFPRLAIGVAHASVSLAATSTATRGARPAAASAPRIAMAGAAVNRPVLNELASARPGLRRAQPTVPGAARSLSRRPLTAAISTPLAAGISLGSGAGAGGNAPAIALAAAIALCLLCFSSDEVTRRRGRQSHTSHSQSPPRLTDSREPSPRRRSTQK